jgi:hypothetical protein
MWSRLKTFYFMIVSFASLIGVAVCLWTVLYASSQQLFITDEEYLQSYNAYEIRQCEEPKVRVESIPTQRTDEEIQACKNERTENTLIQRGLNFKEALLWWVSRGIVFLIIFLFHFPVFRKLSDEK